LLSESKIEKQVEAIQSQKCKVAVSNYVEFDDDSKLSEHFTPVNQASFIYSTNNPAEFLVNLYGGNGTPHFIQTNCWLVPRELIDKAGGWRAYRCPDDDGEFFARILLASSGIVYVPDVYNFYRRIPNTLSSNTHKKYLQNTLLTIDLKHEYLNQFESAGKRESISRAIATQYLHFAVYAYPRHLLLCKIAIKRYKAFRIKIRIPVLGGRVIEIVKATMGWKTAQIVKYYLGKLSM
jgi:hypothetical protein